MILTEEQSGEVVRRLRRDLDPQAIYLFGSQATGTAKQETSDVDLCIIVREDGEDTYRKTVKAYRSLRDVPFAKDVVVRERTDFEQRSQWLNSLESEVQKTGRLLFHA